MRPLPTLLTCAVASACAAGAPPRPLPPPSPTTHVAAPTVSSTTVLPVPPAVPVPAQPQPELGVGGRLARAVGHSRAAFAYLTRARGTPKGHKDWRVRMIAARDEYERADAEWATIAAEDRPPEIVYQAEFWAADARMQVIEIQRALGEPFSALKIEGAISAAIIARDSPLGGAWVRVPAAYVVDLTAMLVEEAHRAFVAGKCAAPAPKIVRIEPASRDAWPIVFATAAPAGDPLGGEPKSSATSVLPAPTEDVAVTTEPGEACLSTEPDATRVWVRDIPPVVMRWLRGCQELLARLPVEHDRDRVWQCRLAIARTLLHYGHLKEATVRLDAIRNVACGAHTVAVDAECDLLVAAVLADDDRTYVLRASLREQPCAVDLATKERECDLSGSMHCSIGRRSADEALAKAVTAADPSKRATHLREALTKYRYLLEKGSFGTLRIAANAAYCASQLGDHEAMLFALLHMRTFHCTDKQLVELRDGGGTPYVDGSFEDLAKECVATAFALGQLYLDVPGLDGLRDVYRFEQAIDWFRACKQGPAKAFCPADVDAVLARAMKAHAAARATEDVP